MELSLVTTLVGVVYSHVFFNGLVVFFADHWDFFVAAIILGYLVTEYKNAVGRERSILFGWALTAALFARFFLVEIVRLLVPRMRPFVQGDFTPLVEHAATGSLPSGHATFFMALSVFIFLGGKKKMGWFLLISTIVISVARVFAGLHFPTDILAGWFVGAFAGGGVWYVYIRLSRRQSQHKKTPAK